MIIPVLSYTEAVLWWREAWGHPLSPPWYDLTVESYERYLRLGQCAPTEDLERARALVA